MTLEFWVVRVLMHRGPVKGPMRVGDNTRELPSGVIARVVAGELACIPPDNVIAEPLACFANQLEADEDRDRRARDDAAGDYRVILNADGV